MKKIILMLLFACFFFPTSMHVFAENSNEVKVLYTSINIYNHTSIASDIIAESSYGSKLTLLQTNPIQGDDELFYYKISVNIDGYSEGYVLCSHVLDLSLDSPKKDLDYNANLNQDASTYIFNDDNYKIQSQTIKAGTKIKILDGYDSNKEFIRIQYKDNSGDIITTYIKTNTISVSGISRGTIGAILIIITTVSLVLIVFGVKGNRKRKKLN